MNKSLLIVGMITFVLTTCLQAVEEVQDPEFEKAYELYNQGQYDEAMAGFQAILEKDAGHVRASVYYGVSLMGKEQFDEAIVELEKALSLDPKLPLTSYALAVSYARKTPPDTANAEKYLKAAKDNGYRVPPWFDQYLERLKTDKKNP